MDCTVREWFTEVQKDRSSRSCPSTPSRTRSQQPIFQFSFFNPTTQNWTECGKGRAGAGKSFENISNILCDVQGFEPKESDNIIIRLRKMFMSTKILRLGEVDCQDETFLAITGDFFEVSGNNSLSYGSTAVIIIVSTGFLLLLIFCCLKQLKLRRNLELETSPGKSVTLLNHEDQETSFTPLSIPGKRTKEQVMRETVQVMRETVQVMRETEQVMRETEQVMRETEQVMRETEQVVRETEQVMRETEQVMRETEQVMRETDQVMRETGENIDISNPRVETSIQV
ncbi:uncharacterized protein LOC111700012 [Eurytemora carolleeae]|uniref:uncharacterized protein LOC111700012 n=1 Tax=Eurytemora carolleeae TaxID=1294199 RepID=UPI000C78F1C0|nr:uncharacterized protein LOC111700012 [Eurytemora carolleeae]|eukprot:XP_023326586.1 uncharacterized protein LOC111700012 [Eurytemora affinis]